MSAQPPSASFTLGNLRIPTDWGLEIGVVSEVYRSNSNKQICQVDIADNYDHKHQDLSLDDQNAGLSRMSLDIARSLYRKLAIQGTVFNQETFRTLKATYYRMALDLIETYRNDAIMNGLSFDIHREEEAIELFAEKLPRQALKVGHQPTLHFLNICRQLLWKVVVQIALLKDRSHNLSATCPTVKRASRSSS